MLHGMQGTPYIYQGEELGMTNVQFDSIEDYEDIETLNMYKERLEKGYQPEEIMHSIYARSRDNARTPMQWSGEENGGFTTGEPWFTVNPNYIRINAKEALEDENSVFYYYQKLIRLRKENPVFVDGKFDLLCRKMRRFLPIREQMSIQRCWYVQTLRMRKLAAHCLMSGKMGKFGFGIMRMTEKEMYCVHMRR